jgi:hypothetical protein
MSLFFLAALSQALAYATLRLTQEWGKINQER